MGLLDFYRLRFGQAVKRQGNGWNGPCPLCGGQPGKSDRFMVWPERSEGLGDACAENGISGIWSCRKCGQTGDTIAYLTKIEGLTFRDALAELGITPMPRPAYRRKAPAEPIQIQAWQPRTWEQPTPLWQEKALKLVEEAEQKIWDQDLVIAWLHGRGIDEAAIRAYRIGWLPPEKGRLPGRFRPRKSWGLEPKTGQDGKVRDKLFIPRGIVIPSFGPGDVLLNLRIRRHREDIARGGPKYLELEGSSHGPLRLRSSAPANLACWFITEAELDAMLIHHVSGGVIGAVAVRTNRGKPDSLCHPLLKAAPRICIALDYDEAGADGVDFWEQTYPQAIRWPTPEGKDPGDACRQGVNIREWIDAALPACASLPPQYSQPVSVVTASLPSDPAAPPEPGQMDACPAGKKNLGEGAEPDIPEEQASRQSEADGNEDDFASASQGKFSQEEWELFMAALPPDTNAAFIPLAVARIWLAWRNVPAVFVWLTDESGQRCGFRWEINQSWKHGHEAEFERFWKLQASSEALKTWFCSHPANRIGPGNVLRLYELRDKAGVKC